MPTSPTGGKKQNNKGLTLIELAVVLAVVGSLVLISLPRIAAFGQAGRLKSDARRIIAASILARSEAVTRGRTVDLLVDLKAGRLTIAAGPDRIWTGNMTLPGVLKGLAVRNQAETGRIAFTPDGRVNETAFYLSDDGDLITIHLEPLTGQAETLAGHIVYDWTS